MGGSTFDPSSPGGRGLLRAGATSALAGVLVALALVSGCEQQASDDWSEPYSVSSPEHPASKAPVSLKSGSSGMGSGAGSMPAGHPPVGAAPSGGGLPADHPPMAAGAGAASGPAGSATGPLDFEGVEFTAPEGWVREVPANRFRLAQFRLPKVEGAAEDGVVTISSAMGSVDQNIARWEGQFQSKAERTDRTISGHKVILVSMAGSFGGKSGQALRAAIIQAPEGQLFVKGWGPEATIAKWSEAFDALLESMREAK